MRTDPDRISRRNHSRTVAAPVAGLGFTLIELLVVVAMIGILAALLFPAMAGAKADNWRAQCQSQMKQLGLGINLFSADRNAMFPAAGCANEGGALAWDSYVHRYIGGAATDTQLLYGPLDADVSPTLLQCPADRLPRTAWFPDVFGEKSFAMVAVGPAWATEWQVPLTAAGKYVLPRLNRGVGVYWRAPADWEAPGYRTSVVRDPAATLLLVEIPSAENRAGSIWPCIAIGPVGTSPEDLFQFNLNDPASTDFGRSVYRSHGNRFNYLFHDGHVGPFTIEQTVGLGTTNAPKGMWTVAAGD